MPSKLCIVFIKLILPYATWWVGRQEKYILKEGVELNDDEKQWATDVGVQDVDQVRIVYTRVVPLPGSPLINHITGIFGLHIAPLGISARYGIYIDKNSRNDPSLLVHELVHVGQYERLGGIKPFLNQYFNECLRNGFRECFSEGNGYWDAALELEARTAAIPYNRPPDR